MFGYFAPEGADEFVNDDEPTHSDNEFIVHDLTEPQRPWAEALADVIDREYEEDLKNAAAEVVDPSIETVDASAEVFRREQVDMLNEFYDMCRRNDRRWRYVMIRATVQIGNPASRNHVVEAFKLLTGYDEVYPLAHA